MPSAATSAAGGESCVDDGQQQSIHFVAADYEHEMFLVQCLNLFRSYLSMMLAIDVFVNNDGWIALMYASDGGHIECVRCLVESGKADVGTQDNRGWTALIYASIVNHSEVCEYLKGKGAVEMSRT